MTDENKKLQKCILERMIKITPHIDRLCELFEEQGVWHKWKKTKDSHYVEVRCGKIIKELPNSKNYSCEEFINLFSLNLCPDCLMLWSKDIEESFLDKCELKDFDITLSDTSIDFFQFIVETEGYDSLNEVVNRILVNYIKENNLLSEEMKRKKYQKQN